MIAEAPLKIIIGERIHQIKKHRDAFCTFWYSLLLLYLLFHLHHILALLLGINWKKKNSWITSLQTSVSMSQLLRSRIMISKKDATSVIPNKLKSSILYILYKSTNGFSRNYMLFLHQNQEIIGFHVTIELKNFLILLIVFLCSKSTHQNY